MNYLQKSYWLMRNLNRIIVPSLNVHNLQKSKYFKAPKQYAPNFKSPSIRYYLYATGLIQIGLLHYVIHVSLQITLINIILFSAAFYFSIPLMRQLKTPGLFIHSWVTWTIGGIGMLLGHTLDSYLAGSTVHVHHHSATTTSFSITEVYSFLFSGMTSLMLIFCIPACVCLCNAKLSRQNNLRKWVLHLSSGLSMLIGMFLAVQTEQYLLANINDTGSASYYFMLILMLIFSSSTYYLVFRVLNRKTIKPAH